MNTNIVGRALPDADGSVLTTNYTNRTDWGTHAARVLVSAASPKQSYLPTKHTKLGEKF